MVAIAASYKLLGLDLRTTEAVETPLILFGIYDDVYRKHDERWRIQRTRIDFLWPRRAVSPPSSQTGR